VKEFNAKENTILLLSYSDVKYDGRLRELIKICKNLGDTYTLIKDNSKTDLQNYNLNKRGGLGIFEFIRKSLSICKANKINIVFLDNRMSCIPGLLIRVLFPKMKIVQDVRELYIINERKGIKSKIGCLIEGSMIKRSDIIICANEYRAQKMLELYGLKEKPLVYENLRQLQYGINEDIDLYKRKYEFLLEDDIPIIISTSGVEIKRTNDKLVEAFEGLKNKAKLLLVGGGTTADRNVIEEIIKRKKLDNVFLIEKIPEGELKYLISISKIGIVNYGTYDTNNLYCASGKVYEFLYEKKPVVTTINPPLKEMCELYGVGESGERYLDGIEKVLSNYNQYTKNIDAFLSMHSIEANNFNLEEEIKKGLSS